MLADVVDLLDRRCAALTRREHVRDFLLHLEPFLEALDREPRLRIHLADMHREAERTHDEFNATDASLLARVKALRERVPRIAELDDGEDEDSREERYCLDAFDEAARQQPPRFLERLLNSGVADTSISEKTLEILRVRMQFGYPKGDPATGTFVKHDESVQALFRELNALLREQRISRRRFSVKRRTSGLFAVASLRAVLRQLNPPEIVDPLSEQALDDELSDIIGNPTVVLAVVHDGTPSRQYVGGEKEIERTVRDLVDRAYEELRARVGAVLSLRSLIFRFKVRAEAYEHEELSAIASDEDLVRKEDKLADRLAAFLFDQGLMPLTRPMIGRLSPDIVAPDLYVEAKQFADRAAALKNIRYGAKQVWDTFNRLRGTPHEVREAYLVVFRRAGPSVVFEAEQVHAGGATLHAILIDVAPNSASGSRQKEKPVTITAADLLPQSPGSAAALEAPAVA